jgi:hypothetical protein
VVIVKAVHDDPRHAVAAVNMAGPALAQRTGAIVDADLRNGAERELAASNEKAVCKTADATQSRIKSAKSPSALASEKAWSIVLTNRRAKAMRSVSKLSRSASGAPSSVAFSFHARLMASPILSAGGTVDVSRVAEQKRAALAELLRHPVMDVIGREPARLVDP